MKLRLSIKRKENNPNYCAHQIVVLYTAKFYGPNKPIWHVCFRPSLAENEPLVDSFEKSLVSLRKII